MSYPRKPIFNGDYGNGTCDVMKCWSTTPGTTIDEFEAPTESELVGSAAASRDDDTVVPEQSAPEKHVISTDEVTS